MNEKRNFKLKLKQKLDEKGNINQVERGVITDVAGNQSGTGTIWANRNTKRIWWMKHGATQPAQIRCQRVPSPYIGLKVIAGYAPGNPEKEVLSDDPLDRAGNVTGDNWTTLDTPDLLPGGRAMLWLQTKAIEPLATWPGTGLKVNINPGNYKYANVWTTYIGISDYDISAYQPAGPNEHCLVGLYLDSTGALGAVAGATVGTGLTPPEPTWPDEVFRLAVVLITDTDTGFNMASDIFDRRDLWNDPAQSGWPFAHVYTVSQTNLSANFDDIQDAINFAADGDAILIDAGTWTLTATLTIDKSLTLIGLGRAIITYGTSPTIDIDAAAKYVYLTSLIVNNTDDTGDSFSLQITACANGTALHCEFTGSGAGSADDCIGVNMATGTVYTFDDTIMTGEDGVVSSVGLKTDGTTFIKNSITDGSTVGLYIDVNGAVTINDTKVAGGITNNGTLTGSYIDDSDNVVIVAGNELDTDTINETTAAAGVTVDTALIKDGEAYLLNDEAGAQARLLQHNLSGYTVNDEFNGAALDAAWLWAAYAGFGTPNTIDMAVPSFVRCYNTAAATFRGYAYRAFVTSASSNRLYARLLAGLSAVTTDRYYGVRFDDGSNTNYAELLWQNVTGLCNFFYRYSIGGVVTGPTALLSAQPDSYYTVELRYNMAAGAGTNARWFVSMDTVRPSFIFPANMTWVPTRWGFTLESTIATAANADNSLMLDWISLLIV